MEPKYEEQLTAYIDFLGFAERSKKTDDSSCKKILDLLLSLSELSGEFDVELTKEGTGKSGKMTPVISTFSDNIVISYPLKSLSEQGNIDDGTVAISTMNHLTNLVVNIGASAIGVGFLNAIRKQVSQSLV